MRRPPKKCESRGQFGHWLVTHIYDRYPSVKAFGNEHGICANTIYTQISEYVYPTLYFLKKYSLIFNESIETLIDMVYNDQENGVREIALFEKENKDERNI